MECPGCSRNLYLYEVNPNRYLCEKCGCTVKQIIPKGLEPIISAAGILQEDDNFCADCHQTECVCLDKCPQCFSDWKMEGNNVWRCSGCGHSALGKQLEKLI